MRKWTGSRDSAKKPHTLNHLKFLLLIEGHLEKMLKPSFLKEIPKIVLKSLMLRKILTDF